MRSVAAVTRAAWPLLVALGTAWGCGGSASRRAAAPAPAVASATVVTAEELANVEAAHNLYEALQSLRPSWFWIHPTSRRTELEGNVMVYVDDMRLGGPETLQQVHVKDAKEVRFLSPSEAEARYGQGNLHGVIQVKTKP